MRFSRMSMARSFARWPSRSRWRRLAWPRRSLTAGRAGAAALPGKGKPAITLGDKNFPEEYILGDLYQQALQAKGYKVKLKPNLGSTEIAWKALQSGQIQAYPEYDGTLLATVAGITKNAGERRGGGDRDRATGLNQARLRRSPR